MRVSGYRTISISAMVLAASFSLAQGDTGKPKNLIPDLKPILAKPVLPETQVQTRSESLGGGLPTAKEVPVPAMQNGGRDGHGRGVMSAAVDAFTSGNYALAKVLLSAPGRENDPVANYCLGMMREYGLGVERDEVQAFKHYQLSANGGHPQASFNLGLMFADGRGAGVDVQSAFAWVKKAAEQGLPIAQHMLGLMYYNGNGTEQDAVQALMWFELAAASGHASSEPSRDTLARSLKTDERLKARQLASLWQPKATGNPGSGKIQ